MSTWLHSRIGRRDRKASVGAVELLADPDLAQRLGTQVARSGPPGLPMNQTLARLKPSTQPPLTKNLAARLRNSGGRPGAAASTSSAFE